MSIRPRVVEFSDGIDVCVEPLKTRFKTVFSFLNCLEKFIQNYAIWRAGRLVYFPSYSSSNAGYLFSKFCDCH